MAGILARAARPPGRLAMAGPLPLLLVVTMTLLARHGRADDAPASPARVPTLRFEVCGNMEEQRLSLAYGVMLAEQLGRAPLLPLPSDDGTDKASALRMYDVDHLCAGLVDAGFTVLCHQQPAAVESRIDVEPGQNLAGVLSSDAHRHAEHLAVGCPLFQLERDVVVREQAAVWATLRALRPRADLQVHVDAAVAELHAKGRSRAFNMLHLPPTADTLQALRSGRGIDGDYDSAAPARGKTGQRGSGSAADVTPFARSLLRELGAKGIAPTDPLYVRAEPEADWGGLLQPLLDHLRAGGYQTVLGPDLKALQGAKPKLGEAQRELADYYVALEAARFVGNTDANFTALAILERRERGRWASHFNRGAVPLGRALPLFRLPWVFTYNSWSESYDYMLKAAVESGVAAGSLVPLCLFHGKRSAPIARWMAERGVQLLFHQPKWEGDLVAKLDNHGDNVRFSHLFESKSMQVGTWQRIDIPIMPELDQYNYVLFTDADVFFRKHVVLEDFDVLPETIGMTPERDNEFPYNAGVMLMNLPALRASYSRFLEFVLSNEHGLFFPGYGPGDQGALNQFHEHTVRRDKLPFHFNAKPYLPFDSSSFIVHFHGPKPIDYLHFARTSECTFGNMCSAGFSESLCRYVWEWRRFVRDDGIGDNLQRACWATLGRPPRVSEGAEWIPHVMGW